MAAIMLTANTQCWGNLQPWGRWCEGGDGDDTGHHDDDDDDDDDGDDIDDNGSNMEARWLQEESKITAKQ